MQDIKFIKDEDTKTYDIAIENGDLKTISNFDTALDMSILTNSRADTEKITPEKRDGWPGNIESIVEERQIGSLLWLLYQARLNQNTVNKAVDYVRKCLDWMTEDGVTSNVSVSGTIVPRQGIQLQITITALTGIVETRYYNLWELTGK